MGDSMFFYDGEILHLGNFVNVLFVDEKIIKIKYSKYILIVLGNLLKIIQLSEDEMYIQGIIDKMEICYEK